MLKLFKLIFVLAAIVLFIFFISYSNAIGKPSNRSGEDFPFTVKSGESVSAIARDLKSAGIIKSEYYFKLYVWLNKLQSGLQAGEYILSSRLSIKEIAAMLSAGQIKNREKIFKIIEGWTISDIEKSLEKNKIISDKSFSALAKRKIGDWQFSYAKPDFLADAPGSVDLEGYLFPDTYRIYVDASAEDIIKKALDNFNIKLSPDLREAISQQNKSIHEIITMASIIEKEVSNEADRNLVSGIFWKRLSLGIALQADSTVNYATGKSSPGVSFEDKEIDSPFNTYKYRGLPPGPICSPSLSSIKAAIYPEQSPYLYYLNRQDTGETIFSKTYEEHLENKNKYLK